MVYSVVQVCWFLINLLSGWSIQYWKRGIEALYYCIDVSFSFSSLNICFKHLCAPMFCAYVYNCYIFLMNSLSYLYIVAFFVSCDQIWLLLGCSYGGRVGAVATYRDILGLVAQAEVFPAGPLCQQTCIWIVAGMGWDPVSGPFQNLQSYRVCQVYLQRLPGCSQERIEPAHGLLQGPQLGSKSLFLLSDVWVPWHMVLVTK